MIRLITAVSALLLASPLAGQEWQVAREQFTFVGTRLMIQVEADAPGTLRLIRGQPGTVRVASRAQEGFTTSGLAEDDRLTLTAAGDGPVDYLVAVPENVWVDVRLPGWVAGRSVARGRAATWDWNVTARPTQDPITAWVPGLDTEGKWMDALYTTFSRDLAPAEVSVPDLSTVARISVRVEGGRFKVSTGRPLSVQEGSRQELVIRPAAPPMDVVLYVPAGTSPFTLRLGGATALTIDGTTVTTLCEPVIDQRLSNGRRWFTFNPLDGALRCASDLVQRHGG